MPEQDQHQHAAEKDMDQAGGLKAAPGGQAQGYGQHQAKYRQHDGIEKGRQEATVDEHRWVPGIGILAIIYQ